MKNCKKICKTLKDTEILANKFAKLITNGCFVNLYGEIGAGKTAFVKLVANSLGVKERVTSPSFVILNEYHTGSIPVYHFDLYRLENEGINLGTDKRLNLNQANMVVANMIKDGILEKTGLVEIHPGHPMYAYTYRLK